MIPKCRGVFLEKAAAIRLFGWLLCLPGICLDFASGGLQGSLSLELGVVQLRVEAVLCHQFLMIALFYDIPVFHDQNHIRVPD